MNSPYLWGKTSSKPLVDEMRITHQGRSETVKRALSDFGSEESFAQANKRFKEHYHYDLGSSAVARTTKDIAQQAVGYVEDRLSNIDMETSFRISHLLPLNRFAANHWRVIRPLFS